MYFRDGYDPRPAHLYPSMKRDATEQKEEDICPITGEAIKHLAITPCFHKFEAEAIKKWINQNAGGNTCPTCRNPLTKKDIVVLNEPPTPPTFTVENEGSEISGSSDSHRSDNDDVNLLSKITAIFIGILALIIIAIKYFIESANSDRANQMPYFRANRLDDNERHIYN